MGRRSVNATEALELVKQHRDALETRAINAELHLKRAILHGAEVDEEAVGALVEALESAGARVADLTPALVERTP